MNTIWGVFLSIIAGIVLWGVPRILVKMPSWGVRVFWVLLVAGLMISIKVPEPYNLAMMGLLAGMAIFENLYQHHLTRAVAREEARLAKKEMERRERSNKRKSSRLDAADKPAPAPDDSMHNP